MPNIHILTHIHNYLRQKKYMYREKVVRVCKLTEFFPLSKVKINLYLNTFQTLKVLSPASVGQS